MRWWMMMAMFAWFCGSAQATELRLYDALYLSVRGGPPSVLDAPTAGPLRTPIWAHVVAEDGRTVASPNLRPSRDPQWDDFRSVTLAMDQVSGDRATLVVRSESGKMVRVALVRDADGWTLPELASRQWTRAGNGWVFAHKRGGDSPMVGMLSVYLPEETPLRVVSERRDQTPPAPRAACPRGVVRQEFVGSGTCGQLIAERGRYAGPALVGALARDPAALR